jgi:hypothetical protein
MSATRVGERKLPYQFDSMSRGCGEMPNAFLAGRIGVRVVRAENFAVRRPNFVFASAFLAVVTVFVQRESVVARAHVRADGVATFLLTAAVVDGALVLVGEVNGGEARLLHRVIRSKFDAQDVALRCDSRWKLCAAEDAVLPQFIFAQFAAHFDVVVFTVLLRGVKANRFSH